MQVPRQAQQQRQGRFGRGQKVMYARAGAEEAVHGLVVKAEAGAYQVGLHPQCCPREVGGMAGASPSWGLPAQQVPDGSSSPGQAWRGLMLQQREPARQQGSRA